MIKRIILLFAFLLFLVQCKKTEVTVVKPVKGLIADSAMVVSARNEASTIGAYILKKGGNAFDAMIATDLALAVVHPTAGNIGGGGFIVYRTNTGEAGALDFREKAPLAAHRDMYLDEDGNVIPGKSTLGALAVGVPGTVAGLFEIHDKLGSMPFSELIQPSIDLARNGFVITKNQAGGLNYYRKAFKKANGRVILFDHEWKEGDTLRIPKLALTLERIRDQGREEFYSGATADMIVDRLSELGGILTKQDLEKYKTIWRDPIVFDYKEYKIISMSPPSSGGVCLEQLLKSIEPYDISQYAHNSEAYIQLITEAERRVYADRAYFLGDPDFVSIPMGSLRSNMYNKNRMDNFSWERATPSHEISHGSIELVESNETTHYSIVDSYGNAVAVTNTLNGGYGSKVFVEEGGFFLNNEMDDFSSKVGFPNVYGLVGAEANSIVPEKRMLSSMTPTIIEEKGKLKMVVGSPGGSTIITSVFQNVINVIEYDMGMQESVSSKRFHHQWLPDMIFFEEAFDTISYEGLRNKGYHINHGGYRTIGRVDAILVLPDGSIEGGADPRGDDSAVGF